MGTQIRPPSKLPLAGMLFGAFLFSVTMPLWEMFQMLPMQVLRWFLAIQFFGYWVMSYFEWRRYVKKRTVWEWYQSGHCPSCGYDLIANTSPTCPECGHVIAAAEKDE